ncbi:ribosome-binding factor A [candidate division KSB3 bacterium]|uniref:Ribosome-binding factor A n=1 Tax=candidate division KSB3 bacterium TaxID=2044937 RepID=A0A2G6E064_9BACT|nr:MAG: ribosome-binding factor A [candidate division KSB3 bacterium]
MSIWDPKQTLDSIGAGSGSEQKRSSRVAEAIKNELSELLVTRVADPRLAGAHISRVEVSGDLGLARIFYTVFGDKKQIRAAGKGFDRASGFMRSHIAKTLNLRFTPALQFQYDSVADKVAELDGLFQEIANERKVAADDS